MALGAAFAALFLFALSGCGGSNSDTAGSTSGGGQTAESTSGKQKESGSVESGSQGSTRKQGGGSTGSSSKVQTAPLKVSGGGSAQYRMPGGDNSVQNFGEEGDDAELEEAATTLHDYLVARAEEDWPTACANLSKSVEEQLQGLASRAKGLAGKGCAAILRTLTPKLPASVRRESTIVDAGSLRLEGDQAFLLYKGAEGKVYTVLMAPEDGEWRVGTLSATPIS